MSDLGDFSSFEPSDEDDATEEASTSSDTFEAVGVETRSTPAGFGTVAATEGLRLGEREEETTIRSYITVDNRSAVRLGRYLVIPYPDEERLFTRVEALEYAQEFRADDATEIHARRAMTTRDVDERDFKFLADLRPLAILSPDEDGELSRRMADRVPKPETVVRPATDEVEITTGLNIPEDGVFLGHLSVGGQRITTATEPPTVAYRLLDDYDAGDPLVFRHTLIAGGTGSGKTHAAKNVLRQFLAEDRRYPLPDEDRAVRPAVVMFDPQDEYAQMHDDNPALDSEHRRRYEREGIAVGGHEDTIAFAPAVEGSRYSASDHRAEVRPISIPFELTRSNPWLLATAGLNDNQYNGLRHLLDRFFRERSETTFQAFADFLQDPALRAELDESGRVHEATFDSLQRRVLVRSLRSVFDGDATPITECVREFIRPGGLSTVPTYHISDSRAREIVVLALASLLVDEKLSSDPRYNRIKETPLVLGLDEAHNFLGNADSAQGARVIGKFTDAAKQGRKERLGLFLITQDPQDIDGAVFKQINTRMALNLGDEDAIDSMNLPTALSSRVPYLERGEFVVYSPDNSDPVEVMGLSSCVTRHG